MSEKLPRIAFRVDESMRVGFGHMSRCLALACALLKANAEISFWCRDLRSTTCAALNQLGIALVVLPSEEAFLERDWRDSVVIVDGYQFDQTFWLRLLERRPQRTVYIDDFRAVRYTADIVVCFNEGVDLPQFQLAPNSRLYLGGRYLLLRPQVLTAAERAGRLGPNRAIMIASGGTQQVDWVASMLRRLSSIAPSSPLWVLSARRLPVARVLHRAGVSGSRVRFFCEQEPPAMIRLYCRAQCLITPASTMMLEAFAAGCPVISGWIALNQRNSLNYYSRQGLLVNAGDLREVSSKTLTQALAEAVSQSSAMRLRQRAYIQCSKSGILEIVSAILARE
jgi:UDP-2,4-diacetamido-2,4,6-trideoxy-beta-L-altropyranose hydrolase